MSDEYDEAYDEGYEDGRGSVADDLDYETLSDLEADLERLRGRAGFAEQRLNELREAVLAWSALDAQPHGDNRVPSPELARQIAAARDEMVRLARGQACEKGGDADVPRAEG